ncbi:peroxide stress protein YaaA [Dactylosporangium sp. AC04546]|uniref:peroxide stress protein YaaA n=1 Tax=Dactylosporangium sp. AC04546 TaxID=2862460 RepID=UPI001EDF402B|nr:peroxide stress protein YaaA [Dactylosporangium sp. AC04546]WVK82023.1 peroxide stress protein YaaA [Dactylosporangium sp. AC04546]
MLILLPPSEGKAAAPRRGSPLDLDGLMLPELRAARETVLDELTKLSADPEAALATLGLSAGQGAEVERNAVLRDAPAVPAGKLYTGVLYDALDLASLPAAAKRRAREQLLIFSGLWGVLGLADRIPPYRCSIGVRLPGAGSLSAHWKAALAGPLGELAGDDLVLDLRSSAYVPMWAPRNGVSVRVLHDGKVVSHFNKATKGRIVRDLLLAGARPRTPERLAQTLEQVGYRVQARRPDQLDVVVDTL